MSSRRRRPLLGAAVVAGVSTAAAKREVAANNQRQFMAQQSEELRRSEYERAQAEARQHGRKTGPKRRPRKRNWLGRGKWNAASRSVSKWEVGLVQKWIMWMRIWDIAPNVEIRTLSERVFVLVVERSWQIVNNNHSFTQSFKSALTSLADIDYGDVWNYYTLFRWEILQSILHLQTSRTPSSRSSN
jgi:hypothetical protein